METALTIMRALADESRVRALMALEGRELCVCQIIELLALAPSTVSKHMTILRQAGLVQGQKRGRWMHYRQAGAQAPPAVAAALAWLRAGTAQSRILREDRKRLAAILKVDRERLCRRQSGRKPSAATIPTWR
jgi:DNA-binding transcriptional ArsR family regulator